jgi:hypothetical protein
MVDTHGTAVRTRRSAGPDPVLDVAELIWEPIAE